MRRALKSFYQAIPFKAPAFKAAKPLLRLPPRLYKHLHFNGTIVVRIDASHAFRLHHFGHHVENDLFWAGYGSGWEATSLELWRRLAPLSSTIFDIGANTGIYALAAAALNPEASITAFEPVERVFCKLAANIRLNGFAVVAEQVAVSDMTGEAVLFDSAADHVYSASLEKEMLAPGVGALKRWVRTVPLQDYVRSRSIGRVDLVKIDVEGHEPAVLRGLGSILRDSRPTMLVEVLSEEIAQQISSKITGMEYQMYHVIEGAGVKRVPTLHARLQQHRNFLLCRASVAELIGITELCVVH